MGIFLIEKEHVFHGQIDQVAATNNFKGDKTHQVGGKNQGHNPEKKSSDDAVHQGFLLLLFRKCPHQNGQDQRIINRKNTFQYGKGKNRQSVGSGKGLEFLGKLHQQRSFHRRTCLIM